ncbi:MAG: hypothetical protein HY893_06735 [Deltaproteobacteria bacterium]|nr:hypothetical protein [Deltaproteobacteria bacterium]
MKDFSIFLPTRGRPFLAKRLLESVVDTASDIAGVEAVLYLDEDDPESLAVSCPGIDIKTLVRPPGASMGGIFRECMAASAGRYILLMNDDAIFRTRGWDRRMAAAFNRYPDRVALVYGDDLDQGGSVPTFPCVSRAACDVMGGVCPASFRNLHIESHLFDIFNELRKSGHNRTIYLKDVVIEHMHHTLGKSPEDGTCLKKDPLSDQLLFIELDELRRHKAKLLARHIEGAGRKSGDEGLKGTVEAATGEGGETLIEVITLKPLPLTFEKGIKLSFIECRDDLFSAYNKGAEGSSAEYLLFINRPISLDAAFIKEAINAALSNGRAAVTGFKELDPANGRVSHAGICFYRDNGIKWSHIYRGMSAESPQVNRYRRLQAVGPDCMLVKREAFLRAGGFDESFGRLSAIDLCMKIKALGMDVAYSPLAQVFNSAPSNLPASLSSIEEKWGDYIECDLEAVLREDGFRLKRLGKDDYRVEFFSNLSESGPVIFS